MPAPRAGPLTAARCPKIDSMLIDSVLHML